MTIQTEAEKTLTPQELGTIKKVDLREKWSKEDKDFTPWLAKNLNLLGDELGLDLELQSEEAPVGGYSLDLLARETGTNRQVIIENQLEDTDHSHLGQLLTYASGYDGEIIVWIAKNFNDKHRDALDWLNRRTDENTGFFGVVVELLRIDDSLPAPYFKVISAPNDWRKSTGTGRQRSVPSERMERYRTFFQPLFDTLREKHRFTGAKKAQAQSWYNFSAGVSGISYSASFATGDRAKVGLNLDGDSKDRNEKRFDWLREQKDSIESALGQLEWRRLDNNIACRIEMDRAGNIDDDDGTLQEVRSWMIDNLLRFKEVFGSSIEELRTVDLEEQSRQS